MNETAAQVKRGRIDRRRVIGSRHRLSADTFLQNLRPRFGGRTIRVESLCWCVIWEGGWHEVLSLQQTDQHHPLVNLR
jgi:hypothetical protein